MATESIPFGTTLQELGLGEGWHWEKGSWWLQPDQLDVRVLAETMRRHEARFVAITAAEQPDKEIRLDYQWDLKGKLLTWITATREHQIATIADLIPAADWVERETHEYFAVEFAGRESTPPLMMRAGDAVGVNLRKEVAQ